MGCDPSREVGKHWDFKMKCYFFLLIYVDLIAIENMEGDFLK